jgi:hypothetical protein
MQNKTGAPSIFQDCPNIFTGILAPMARIWEAIHTGNLGRNCMIATLKKCRKELITAGLELLAGPGHVCRGMVKYLRYVVGNCRKAVLLYLLLKLLRAAQVSFQVEVLREKMPELLAFTSTAASAIVSADRYAPLL